MEPLKNKRKYLLRSGATADVYEVVPWIDEDSTFFVRFYYQMGTDRKEGWAWGDGSRIGKGAELSPSPKDIVAVWEPQPVLRQLDLFD